MPEARPSTRAGCARSSTRAATSGRPTGQRRRDCDRGAVEVDGRCGPPLPAEPLDPADGAAGAALAPLLVWKPSYNALTYDVVLATQPPPAGILETVAGITATHWKPQVALSPATTCYWQVRGHSPCGKREVSAVFSFTTQVAAFAPTAR